MSFFQLFFDKSTDWSHRSTDLTSFFADTNSYLTFGFDRVQTTWGHIISVQHLDKAKSSKQTEHPREWQVYKHSLPPLGPDTDLARVQH